MKHTVTSRFRLPRPSPVLAFPNLPRPVTSFGAARIGDAIYLYGGNEGGSHGYSSDSQSGSLWRTHGGRWTVIGSGPRLQGLALVADVHGVVEPSLIRIGGFTATNAEGDPDSLHSQSSVVRWNLRERTWTELPDLPAPRSSHDAAIVGRTIFVIGGWKLDGPADGTWHPNSCRLDLSRREPAWESFAVPFERRALAVVAHAGKIFAIGGMDHQTGPSKRVDVYDPTADRWEQTGSLTGGPMAGFGASAWSTGGHLYVSTVEGEVQRFDDTAGTWSVVRKLTHPRFFHRMLPIDDQHLLLIGGTHMETGKVAVCETVSLVEQNDLPTDRTEGGPNSSVTDSGADR